MSESRLLHARAREAALKRHRPPDDPAVIAAVADRRNAAAEQYIQRLLVETPPLTSEERQHLARLLTPPGSGWGPGRMSNVGPPPGRSMVAITATSGSAEWKAHVYRHHGPGLGNGVRVLLLLLADHMDERRRVSLPRPRLAAKLGITEDQVKKRVAAAKKAGLLDNVVKGHNGVAAVYQGLFASGPIGSSGTREGAPSRGGREQTPTPRRGTDPRTATGYPEPYPYKPSRGGQKGAPISKSDHSTIPGREPTAPREKPRALEREDRQPTQSAPGSPPLQRLSSEALPPAQPHRAQPATVAGFETEPQRDRDDADHEEPVRLNGQRRDAPCSHCRRCSGALVGRVQQTAGLCGPCVLSAQKSAPLPATERTA